MSTAAAAAPANAAPAAAPGGKKKKKLIVVGAAVLVLLLALAGGGFWWLKMKAAKAAAEAEDGDEVVAEAAHKPDPKAVPTFMPLDPFVVNLADRDTDRFAQIGVTLELVDAAAVERMKAFMPAIRNGILLVLADKKSEELLAREGKERLAAEILRESVRPLGIEVKAPMPVGEGDGKAAKGAKGEKDEKSAKADKVDKDEKSAKKKAGKNEPSVPNPVQRVHFSSFIIQ